MGAPWGSEVMRGSPVRGSISLLSTPGWRRRIPGPPGWSWLLSVAHSWPTRGLLFSGRCADILCGPLRGLLAPFPTSHMPSELQPPAPGLRPQSAAAVLHAYLPRLPVCVCFWSLENFCFLASLVIHLNKYFFVFPLLWPFKLFLLGRPFQCSYKIKNGLPNTFFLANIIKLCSICCDFCLITYSLRISNL